MHSYPAHLCEGSAEIGALLACPHVACVDMGHTHDNEIANDGRTVFMATRSTGQIEEGPSGFSIAAANNGRVSWRFKESENAWPCVLVTSPVDRRFATSQSQVISEGFGLRATIFSDAPIVAVEARPDGADWRPMARIAGDESLWSARFETPAGIIRVRATDERGRTDEDVVEPLLPGARQVDRCADGSDRDRIGAWPEKGVLGTQLGPNRKGRKW